MTQDIARLSPGVTLKDGTYRIIRFISHGGFGCTYEAVHIMLDKRIAVKEFFVSDFCNRDSNTGHVSVGTEGKRELIEKLRRKFISEAQAVAGMTHPGIVKVTDVFEENGTAYFVMDYIEGSSLADLSRNAPLPETQAIKYILQVCDALSYVHSKHRLHLDIKPGNIMVDKTGNAILIDFGASKQYDEASGENTSSLLGQTPGFAPPEQSSNMVASFFPATDIYALGATLYKILSGVTPPASGLLASGVTDIAPLPNNISVETRSAIVVAMKLNKNDRPQNVETFASMLGKPASPIQPAPPQSAQTRPIAPIGDSMVKQRGKNKLTLLITICFILIGFLIAIGFLQTVEDREPIDSDFDSTLTAEVEIIDNTETQNTPEEPHNQDPVSVSEQISVASSTPATAPSPATSPTPTSPTPTSPTPASPTPASPTPASPTPASPPVSNTAVATTPAPHPESGAETIHTTSYIYGHEFVDLGLSVKWATCNIGASNPGKYGNYYAWGETSTKMEYTEANSITYGQDITDIKSSNRDAAHITWNGTWRIPTKAEAQELINNCTWVWTTYYGSQGYQVTGPNGNSIFLPAAGGKDGSTSGLAGSRGNYWTSTPDSSKGSAWLLQFSKSRKRAHWGRRYDGFSIRPVSE